MHIPLKSERLKLILTLVAEDRSVSGYLLELSVRCGVSVHVAPVRRTPLLLHALPLPPGVIIEPSMGIGISHFKVQFKLHSTIFALLSSLLRSSCTIKNFGGCVYVSTSGIITKRPWTPSALSSNRQWYLFNKIREFCPEECQDITCPMPSEPETVRGPPTTSSTTVVSTSSATPANPSASEGQPSAKRPRLCGICRELGHNARSCPNKPS